MSWPHVLSLSRVVAGPIVAGLVLSKPGNAYLIAALVFAISSASDLVDGKLARYKRSVSPFGVFLDTTADKVLVSLVLISLAVAGLAPAWPPLVIIGREFLISGLRSYAASRNRIISAHTWGKGKAAITMLAIFVLRLPDWVADGRLAVGPFLTPLLENAEVPTMTRAAPCRSKVWARSTVRTPPPTRVTARPATSSTRSSFAPLPMAASRSITWICGKALKRSSISSGEAASSAFSRP